MISPLRCTSCRSLSILSSSSSGATPPHAFCERGDGRSLFGSARQPGSPQAWYAPQVTLAGWRSKVAQRAWNTASPKLRFSASSFS